MEALTADGVVVMRWYLVTAYLVRAGRRSELAVSPWLYRFDVIFAGREWEQGMIAD